MEVVVDEREAFALVGGSAKEESFEVLGSAGYYVFEKLHDVVSTLK